jgi:hypothetical protein
MITARSLLASTAALLFPLAVAQAQETSEVDLRKDVQNPVAALTKVTVGDVLDLNGSPANRGSHVIQTQIVAPIHLNEGWLLVPKIVVNVWRWEAGVSGGVGDSTPTFFISPARSGRVIWGFGPAFLLPTATRNSTGAGTWGIGPAMGMFTQPRWGTIGFTVQNTWSVGGASNRSTVNRMALQPSLQYNLPKDWYVTTQPEMDADWNAGKGNTWTVPLGGGIGRVFQIGKQSLAGTLLIYRNVGQTGAISSLRWQIVGSLTFLFPHKQAESVIRR